LQAYIVQRLLLSRGIESYFEQCHLEQHSLPALLLKPITKYNLRLALVHCALRHRVHLCCVKTVHTPLSCQVEHTVGSVLLGSCPKEHSSYINHSTLTACLCCDLQVKPLTYT